MLIVAAVAGASYYVLNRDEVSVVGNKTTNSAASGITFLPREDKQLVFQWLELVIKNEFDKL